MHRKEVRQFRLSGFVSIVLVIFIIIIGLLGVAAAYLFTLNSASQTHSISAIQAFYLTETGVEVAIHQMLSPNLSHRVACEAYRFEDESSYGGTGAYLVRMVQRWSALSPAVLQSTIGLEEGRLSLSDASSYAPSGRIKLDQEWIDYDSKIGNDLLGLKRGRDGSLVSSHSLGSPAAQYQCDLLSESAVPSFALPEGKRHVKFGVQLQTAVALGDKSRANQWLYYRWNAPIEGQWNTVSVSMANSQDCRGLHLLNSVYGWAVGDKIAGNLFALRWDGKQWTRVLPNPAIKLSLNTVYCNAYDDCWALGESGRELAYYDGKKWIADKSDAMPNAEMNSVFCTAKNDCWAVGKGRDFARYTGGGIKAWKTQENATSIPDVTYRSLYCVAGEHCRAVGDSQGGQASIVYWDGKKWSRESLPEKWNTDLQGISCSSDKDCWAVGKAVGQMVNLLHWDGNSWANTALDTKGNDLFSVACFHAKDCWAVGQNGIRVHWDGEQWSVIDSGRASVPNLNVVSVQGAAASRLAFWQNA